MSSGNFDLCLREILHHEGGFVNHPKDPGGMTNLGVTKATYEAWIGHKVDERIMRALTPQLVAPLYKRNYWGALHCADIPSGLDLCVFDFGVNAGVRRAARYLQRLVGVPVAEQDGVVGAKTLALAAAYCKEVGRDGAVRRYQAMREEYYKQLPTFATFGKGWLRRVDEVAKTALALAKQV